MASKREQADGARLVALTNDIINHVHQQTASLCGEDATRVAVAVAASLNQSVMWQVGAAGFLDLAIGMLEPGRMVNAGPVQRLGVEGRG